MEPDTAESLESRNAMRTTMTTQLRLKTANATTPVEPVAVAMMSIQLTEINASIVRRASNFTQTTTTEPDIAWSQDQRDATEK